MTPGAQNPLKLAVCILLLGTVAWLYAGSLTPPPGAVTPTMKTLVEVEPRVAVQTLRRDNDAVWVIRRSGSYYLTGDLTGTAEYHGIKIIADDVTLDLGGFTLSGIEGSRTGILLQQNLRNVTIRNGVVADWGEEGVGIIDGVDTINPLITDLVVARNQLGIALRGQQIAIRDCRVSENELDGIVISNGTVDGCTVTANGRVGIEAVDAILRNCRSRANLRGFDVEACTVVSCVADANGGNGFEVQTSVIRDCVTAGNNGVGIRVSARCQVVGNECRFNGDVGILVVGRHNRIDGNSVLGNGTGIGVVDRRNLILRNTSTENNGDAYNIGDGNAFGPIVEARGDLSTIEDAGHPWANFEY